MRMLRIILSRINKMWLLMAAAIMLGLIATWVTTQYLKKREARIEAEAKRRASGGTTVEVVVPRRNLPKGTVVDGSTMAARDVLQDTVYDETVLATDFGKVTGTRLARPVEQGKPLRRSDLEGRSKEFSEILPKGMRAVTIEIDEINSIAQMVRVGNRLDLMLIVSDGDGSGGQQVLSVLQKVKIIATGQILSRTVPAEGAQPAQVQRYSNVTFEVTPDEAARIILAQQMGKIRAVLRSDEDDAITPLAKTNVQSVLRGPGDAKKKKKGGDVEGEELTVEYIIGGKGQSGIGQTQTINVNMPQMGAGAPAAGAGPAVPAGAIPGPTSNQITVPGVGSFPYPSVPGVNAPAPAASSSAKSY
jgi:pilus assembly protein CpaB